MDKRDLSPYYEFINNNKKEFATKNGFRIMT